MTDLKNLTEETLNRLRNKEQLTPEDYAFLIPATERVVEKLNLQADAPEHQIQQVVGGFIVDGVLVKDTIGLIYLRMVLQTTSVDCLELTSGPYLQVDVLDADIQRDAQEAICSYEDDQEPTDYQPYNVTNAHGVFDNPDPSMDDRYIRELRQFVKDGNATGEEIRFAENELAQHTFQGKPKSQSKERNNARLSVRKAIKKTLVKLIENPDTSALGLHLQSHIRFGHTVIYNGDWEWKF